MSHSRPSLKKENKNIFSLKKIKKLFLLTILCGAFLSRTHTVFAATCTASATGNWNTTGTWSCGHVPLSTDDVVISAAVATTITVDTAAVANSVTVTNTAVAGTQNIILAVGGNSLTISTGGGITITGAAAGTRNAQVTVSTGTITVPGSITFNNTRAQFISTGASTTNIGGNFGSGGTLTTSGTGTFNFNGSTPQTIGTYTTYNNVQINSTDTGTGASIARTTTFGGTLTVSTGTFTISDTAGTKTFGDVTVNGTWTNTINEAITISGNLTVNSGATFTSGTAAYTMSGTTKTIGGTITSLTIGSLSVTGTYTNNILTTGLNITTTLAGAGTLTQGASSILNLGGTSAITTLDASASTNEVHYTSATGAQTIKTSTYYNLFVDKSGQTATVGTPGITVNNNLSITAGNLSDGGFQITGNATGSFTLPAGSTLTLGLAAAATTFPTAFTTGHTTLNTASTVNYNSTSAQTISNVQNYGNLTITGAATTKTAGGAIVVGGNLNIASGTLADGGFTITVNGNITNNGTHSGVGKILLSGGAGAHALSGGTSTYGNLELNDSQGATFTGTGTTTITGNFTITSGTITANAFTTALTVNGSTSISGTLIINSTTGTKNFTDITINNGGVWNSTVNEAYAINGNLQNDGTFTSGTGVYTFAGSSKTISGANSISIPSATINGTYINNGTVTVNTALAGAGTLTQGTSSVLNIGGTSTITTLDASASTNEVHYTSTAANQTINTSTYHHLFIEKSGRVGTLGGVITVNGNLTVTAGTLADGGFQITGNATGILTLSASTTLTLGTVATATSFPTFFTAGHISLDNASTVNYNSNVAQTISNIQNYGNLTTTATGAVTKTAAGAITINGTLTNGVNNTLADGGFVLTAKDGVVNNGTISGAGKLYLNGGSGSHTISGATSTFGNVELDDSNGATWSGTGTTTINGTLTITTGILSVGGFTTAFTVSGATSIAASQILRMTSTTGAHNFSDITINNGGAMNFTAAENIAVNGNLMVNGTGAITGTAGTFTFQKVGGGSIGGTASSLTIAGNATFATQYSLPAIFTVNTLTVNTGINETNAGTVTTNTALAGVGTFTQGANTILYTNSPSIAALTATVVPNDVHLTGTGNAAIKATDYYNLFFDGANKTPKGGGGSVNVAGNLTIAATTTLDPFSDIFLVTGITSIFGTLSDTSGNAPSQETFNGLVTVYAGGNWSNTPGESCVYFFHNGLSFSGTSFVSGTGNYTFDTNNQAITGSSPVTIQHVVVTGIQLTNSNTSSLTIPATGDLTGTGEWIQDVNSVLNIAGPSPITTMTAGASGNTVNFNGTASQIVNTSAYQTLNVSANTNGNVNITGDTAANTTLTLGATILATAANKMITGAGATVSRTTGFINGSLQKNVSSGTSTPVFEIGSGTDYTPVNLVFHTVGTSGDVVVNTTPTDHLNITTANLFANKTANRYWTISNNGVGFTTYDATFNFIPTDLDVGAIATNFVPALYSFGTWSYPTLGSALSTSTSLTGLSSFGDFQLGEPNFPATQLALNDPGDMFTNTRLGYTITRKNQFGAPAILGVTTVYLYSSSGSVNKKFYDTSSGGNEITSIDITDGNSTANFWYYDNTVGTYTITASDSTPTADGAVGLTDANDSVTVMPVPTKFVIIDPTDNVVGTPVTVTVQAEDASNTIVPNYNNDVTLVTNGSATGAGLVNIVNGVGTIQVSDHTAETVHLTLSDTQATTLDVTSNQDVVFATGPLFQFIINNPSDTTAGSRSAYTVTRKDQFGNIITTGTSTVYLYNNPTSGFGAFYDAGTAGSVVTSIVIPDGAGSSNFWYQEGKDGTYSVTVSDNSTAPDGTTGVDDASSSINISSGITTVLSLNDPGGMIVGTRLGYTVTRLDAFSNPSTNGNETFYLYSNGSSPNKTFYDAGIAGNVITSVTIMDGSSTANFWYFDDTAGTWTTTTSDNSTAPDGAIGITDSTDDVTVSATPVIPTKIIILNPVDSTAGTATPLILRVVDGTGAIDTTFNGSVTLNTNGSALGGGIVTITSGIGIVNINDNTAETVDLSLTDSGSTGLDVSSTQNVVFTPGPVAQYAVNDPGNTTAGNRSPYVVTRKDQFGNLVTSGIDTVYLYTNSLGVLGTFYDAPLSGNIIISTNIIGGQSSAQFWYEEDTAGSWTVTASDNNTHPDSAGITDANDPIVISPAVTANFILNDPGNMSLSTRLGYTVTRKDIFGNLVTNGLQNVYLYSSSTSANKSFFDSPSGGSTIPFITIPDTASSIVFYYFDDTAGTFTITTSDNSSSPDGAGGIADATDNVTVNTIPIAATKLVISAATDALIGDTVTVTVTAEDNNGNTDTVFTGDVTLHATGSVTGEGLVHLVHGVGTIDITDNVADTSTLSLADTAHTGLNVDSTHDITFSAIAVVSSSPLGSGAPISFAIKFSGNAAPGSLINVLGIPDGGSLAQAVSLDQDVSKQNGSFSLGLDNPDSKAGSYVVTLTDKNNIPGQVKFFPNLPDVASLNNIVFAPTIRLLRSEIRKPDFLSVSGFATSSSVVEAQFDGTTTAKETVTSGSDGSYKLLLSTATLALGKHSVAVRSKVNGKASDFSLTRSFTVTNIFRPEVDLNGDGVLDVRDINIFNTDWKSTDLTTLMRIDFNGDGKVDLQDLSIFTQALKH